MYFVCNGCYNTYPLYNANHIEGKVFCNECLIKYEKVNK